MEVIGTEPDRPDGPGPGDRFRRPLRMVLAVVAVVAAFGYLSDSVTDPSARSPNGSGTPDSPAGGEPSAGVSGSGPSDEADRESSNGPDSRLLLVGRGLTSYDTDTAALAPVPLPAQYSGLPLRDVLSLPGGDVVLLGPPAGGSRGVVVSLPLDRPAEELGEATRVVAGPPNVDKVWLVDDEAARPVRLDGEPAGVTEPLTADETLLAELRDGLLFGAQPAGSGPLEVRPHASARVVVRLPAPAYLVSAARRWIAWSSCPRGCPLSVTRLPDGATRPWRGLPAGLTPAGSLLVSPDGRHWAMPVRREAGGPAPFDVVLGHLDEERSARWVRVAEPAGLPGFTSPPQLRYGSNGWLFLSVRAGVDMLAVGPGPHKVVQVPASLPISVTFTVS